MNGLLERIFIAYAHREDAIRSILKTQRGVRTRSGEENIGCFIRFFAGARLGLVLATVSFAAAFPRAALAPFFFWTFDDYFLRLAIVGPLFWLALRKRIDARSRDNRPRVAATYPESYQQTFSAWPH